jgi:hypothetical protein
MQVIMQSSMLQFMHVTHSVVCTMLQFMHIIEKDWGLVEDDDAFMPPSPLMHIGST